MHGFSKLKMTSKRRESWVQRITTRRRWLTAQAVEKAHKAILVALGLQFEEEHFKRTFGHKIGVISKVLPEALREPTDPTIANKVAALERKAADCRYPGPLQLIPGGAVAITAPSVRITSSQQEIADGDALVQWCKERVHAHSGPSPR